MIPKRVLAEMFSHALESDPDECCGVLVGTGAVAETSNRLKNEHPEPSRRFRMSPLELVSVESAADARGRQIVGIYHSHTFTQAYPSQTDVRNAIETSWVDPHYVLISLVEKTRPVARAFKISEDGRVDEVPILTDGDAYLELGG